MKFFTRYMLSASLIGSLIQPAIATEEPRRTSVVPPTDFILDDNNIIENADSPEVVGSFSASDPEGAETFTYALSETLGANDNASFDIQGSDLVATEIFDFETKSTYTVEVTVTDAQDETTVSTFTINVTDANDPPVNIDLNGTTIAENAATETPIGALSAEDVDASSDGIFTFALPPGEADNEQFTISGNQLLSAAEFDFETQSSYEILVRTSDSEGASSEANFTITVTDVDEPTNQPPTSITLTNSTVAENQDPGATVGTLEAEDAEDGPEAEFTFELVEGEADNDQFAIVGDELQSDAVFDFETKASYEVLVQVADSEEATSDQSFTIDVTNANDPPTLLELTGKTIVENADIGTTVGTLSTTDQDTNDEFVYTLVEGEGDVDNANFDIQNNQLVTNVAFEIEGNEERKVRIRSTDLGMQSIEATFTIIITSVEENTPPTNIELSNTTIAENANINTPVGTLTTTDAEDGTDAEFSYELVEGEGDTNNDQFNIVDNELRTAATFDVEEDEVRQIRIQTTDTGGETFAKTFTITITNVEENSPPTNITLSKSSIAENQPVLTLIGRFSTDDVDASDEFTYTMVGGVGSTDNDAFRISGDSLLSDAVFDFESKTSYLVRIQTSDSQDETFDKPFEITITDIDETVNQPPTDIRLDKQSVAENQPEGTLVGNLFTTDLDSDAGFTYSLTEGEGDADNASFRIRENQLLTGASFDFETKAQYLVRITSTDEGEASYAKAFTIQVTDVNENTNQAPTALLLSNNEIAENEPFNSEIGRFTVEDPDASDRHTVTLVEGDGDDDNGRFQIRDNVLYSLVSFDFEDRTTYSIRVQGRDTQQATITKIFTVSVTDVADNVNQAPSDILLSNTQVSEGQIVNLVVGTLSAQDANPGDTHTFSLVSGDGDDDNAIFSISENQLQTAQIFDFNTQARYRIRVRADDGRGGTLEKLLIITVIQGENNAPTVTNPLADLDAEVGEPFSITLPDNAFTDADANDILAYSVTLADDNPLPTWLSFDADTRVLSGTPPADSPDLLELEVTASDSRGATVSDVFTLTITRVTAVEDEISATWTVYPVPTDRHLLTIRAGAEYEPILQLHLLDMSGRLIEDYPVSAKQASEFTLLLPEALSTGTYFLEIRTAKRIHRKRIVLR